MSMIWDVHCHFPRNFDQADADPAIALDARADALRAAGVTRASLLCAGGPMRQSTMPPMTHDEAIARYPVALFRV